MSDPIMDGIQQVLELAGDHWGVAHYVVSVGLERIIDGQIESATWLYHPVSQPDYVTDGLLLKAEELQHCTVEDDD